MWSSDNAIFNVNGEGLEKLKKTLSLALGTDKFEGYRFSQKHGLILLTYLGESKKNIRFPAKLNADQMAEIAFEWLKTDEAKTVPLEGWDSNADHDGSNELGWRVYTEDWGHVDSDWSAVAIRPAYQWYGK